VEAVIRHSGWSDDGITCSALERLVDAVLQAGQLERLRLPGLGAERGPVFAGGLAVLLAAFDALGIDHMRTSEGALREGLLYDLGGRIRHEDVRARTVAALAKRHQLDSAQAARVEQTAAEYFSQVASEWALTGDGAEQLLRWAAQLHELGLVVAHSQYHKHGSYLLENADLPGFSRQEQRLLAVLVRTHRRKYSNGLFKDLPNNWRLPMQRLAILLRLAVLLHRSRSPEPLPPVRLQPRALGLTLYFPPQWLEQHPLTCADLEQEAELLRAAGFELVSCQTAS
jgi:exopolyphosphatase/guanosine-5'-triphosphate,3'-diphosphate pyrophosphatase